MNHGEVKYISELKLSYLQGRARSHLYFLSWCADSGGMTSNSSCDLLIFCVLRSII